MSISELGRFYYLRNFHDMRCKYGRVLSVIRQQMDREPQAGERAAFTRSVLTRATSS